LNPINTIKTIISQYRWC